MLFPKITNMNCPRCKIDLQSAVVAERNSRIQLDTCPRCEGSWFDSGELSQLDRVAEPVLLEIRNIPDSSEQMAALNCPHCNDHPKMEKVLHPRDYKVVMDFCPTCQGIWLDKGELKAIQQENWLVSMGRIFRWLSGQA